MADGIKQNKQFALSAYSRDRLEEAMNTSDEIKAVCKQRNDILTALIQSNPGFVTKESITKDLGSLAALKNDWLCDQYAAIIKTFVDNAK